MRERRSRRTREERRRVREQIRAGVVIFGSLFVAISAEMWADMIIGCLGI